MTATFYLVRHGSHSLGERVLVGRMDHIALAEEGQRQALRLAERLSHEPISMLQSSPRERARRTAQPIVERLGLALEISSAMDEIEYGSWTGRSFDELERDPGWHAWNKARAGARPPNGESMTELQARVMRHLHEMHSICPDADMAIVTHAEVIRAAILHCLGMSLDDFARIEVGLASISIIRMDDDGAEVIAVNEAAQA